MIVVRNGEVVLRKGYGLANVELGVPIEPGMVFRLGSVTKQFTAAAVLLLEQDGKLSTEDLIEKHLPGYPVHGHKITIAHLLSHTSGIFNYTSIPGYMPQKVRRDLSTEELVDVFKVQPMDFAPGERWNYSNSGYVLLGAIIEKVSGREYSEFIQERIFDRLGMKSSHYGGHQLIPGRVAGYGWDGSGYVNAPYLSMTQPHAAGSLLSTVDDLARWDQALQGHELLTEKSYRKMTARFVLNDGEPAGYGFGFALGSLKGHQTVGHGGGIFGFSTYAMRIPDANAYLAILTNRTGQTPSPGFAANTIAAHLIGKPYPSFKPIELDESVLANYTGVYDINQRETRTVTLEDGHLFTQRTGGGRSKVIPASGTKFFYQTSHSYFEFVLDEAGKPSHMLMYQNGEGEPEKARRTGDVPKAKVQARVDPSLYDTYSGVYRLAPGFDLTIRREGDRLLSQATGQAEVEVFPESRTRFFLKVVDAQLTFVWAPDGSVNEVILHQGGHEVRGKRIE